MLKKKSVILFLLFALAMSNAVGEMVVVRFDHPTNEIIREFMTENFDVAAFKSGEYLDLVIDFQEYENLLESGYHIRITQTETQQKENLHSESELDGYRDYAEMLADLQQAELDHPDICRLYDIGESRGKEYSLAGNTNYDDYFHEIWAVKVSDNVDVEEDEPCVYYLAEHHAREPISLETAMTILDHILNNYGTDPTITQNVDNQQIWFVPLVNPNGHKVVTDELYTMWRKNICDNNGNGALNVTGYYASDGVDPNRNYGWHWGGASNNWTSETYQGTEAFSEPETQAVRDLLAAHHFIAGLSYHTYGELILYPYGYEDGIIAPDQAALSELAIDMAMSIPAQNGGYYTPQASWALYPCTGTTDDFAYGTYGIFGYTVEMATEFIPPANQVQGICNNNLNGALIMLNRTSHSILKGHITDGSTNEPLQVEIFVDGVDNTGVFRNPYLSNQEFGAYYRLLTAGTYDVTFSAYGYESQTIENVVISDSAPTILDIVMNIAVANASLSGIITDADSGEPIENAVVELLNFGIPAATTNAQGEYTISGIYQFTYDLAVFADGYAALQEQVEITSLTTIIDFEIFELDDGTFENGVLGGCWELGGNSDWLITNSEAYEGILSIRSGAIDHNQKSDIQVSLNVFDDAEISFARKVSSEADYDYLKFYIDDVLIDQWSGNENWAEVNYPVSAGIHTFRWSYVKDGGVASGSDCGWLDNISFPTALYLEPPASLEYSIGYPQPGPLWEVNFCWAAPQNADFIGYNMYRDGALLNTSLISEEEYADYVPYGTVREYYVTAVYDEGESIASNVIITDDWPISAGNGIADFPTAFLGNYPNPFNPDTNFKFSLSSKSQVSIHIYNVRGQLIKTLIDREIESGLHSAVWNGEDDNGKKVASGIYFSRMDADSVNKDFTSVKKIILLK